METGKALKRKDAFFGLHFDLHPTAEDTVLGEGISDENIKKLLDRVKPDHIAYDCKGHPGYAGYPSKVGTPSPGIVKDSLAAWRRVTREMGVLLGTHYSGVWDFLAVRQHPQWARVDADGGLDTRATSTFGPYVNELLLPQLKELVNMYEVDSVWLDGECWGTELDYSPAALVLWTSETGFTDAPKDSEDPRWNAWKMFQRRQFEKYLIHWTSEMHAFKAGIEVASNWAYTMMMPKEKIAEVDFISGDFDPMLSVDRARTETRYLTNLGMPWELQSWGFDLVKDQDECLKLPDHLKQEAGVVMMHGGGYMMYFLPTRSGYINDEIINTAGAVADFCHERKKVCFRSVSIPQVAILYSAETQLDRSDKVYTWWDKPLKEIEGTLHPLLEMHYSVDILAEYMLMPRIKEFPLVVIPDSYKLTDEFCEAVLSYVKEGGNLLLLGNQCAKLFNASLGVDFISEPYEVNATLDTSKGKVSARGIWQDIEPITAEVVAYRFNADGQQNRSSYMDIRRQGVSEEQTKQVHRHVAATINKIGKGNIAAVYGPVPIIYFNNHHPFLRSFIGDIVKRIFPNPMVRTDAPACVDLSLRTTQEGSLSVSLLNLANLPVSERRAFLEYVPIIRDIKLEILINNMPKAVTWEPYGQPLEWTWDCGVLSVTVPHLHIHGVAVVGF
jgi:hypothetical protein